MSKEPGTGKTEQMVRGLPRGGSIVIVPNVGVQRSVERAITARHGAVVLAQTHIEIVNAREDLHVIRTMRLPVFVDNSWFYTTPIPDDDLVAEVSALQRNNERYQEAA